MGLPAFVVLDRLSAANGGSLIPDGVGLLVQDEAVVDEATFDQPAGDAGRIVMTYCYPIGSLSDSSRSFLRDQSTSSPSLSRWGAEHSWGRYILLSQVQPLLVTVVQAF